MIFFCIVFFGDARDKSCSRLCHLLFFKCRIFLKFLKVSEPFLVKCQIFSKYWMLWKFLQVSELFLYFFCLSARFFLCQVLWKFLQVSELFLDFLSKCRIFSKCRILLIFLQVPVFFQVLGPTWCGKVPRRLVSGMSKAWIAIEASRRI